MAERTCPDRGNIRYQHYQAAAKAAGAQRNKRKLGVAQVPQSIYRCPRCDGWHVSSLPQQEVTEFTRSINRLKGRSGGAGNLAGRRRGVARSTRKSGEQR